MFETLLSKTFAILSLQFLITWATTVYTIRWFRELYRQGKLGITATKSETGQLDLHLDFAVIKPCFWLLLTIDIIVFLFLLFVGTNNLSIGLPLFTVWSVLTGIALALSLLSVDENLGGKVLAITSCITAGAAVIGMYSGMNSAFLGPILFWALLILIIGNIVRLIISIPRAGQRVMAFFGCTIFIGYLLFDFNRLSEAAKDETYNTWPVAMDFAIEVYLDVINLFLELLDLLSD
ncbi:MAG: Bax inhibitor-1 family protein [bacterium]|nr:Bax inhibitor-1 family protein [bacterium]